MVRLFFNIVLLIFMHQAIGQDLKVMTYNLRLDLESDGENKFNERKEDLATQIKFYEPDVMGTQEGLPHQIEYLSTQLENYKHIGLGRDGENNGESVSIFYNAERIKLLMHNTFWLSETPYEVSMGWDAKYRRICTYALFRDEINETVFWVFNAHLDHAGDLARKNGIALILKKIKAVNDLNFPVVLMGDFNLEPDNKSLGQLKDSFIDTKKISQIKPFGSNGTFNGFKTDYPFNRRIDYIYVSRTPEIVVSKYAVLDDLIDQKFPSDHFPVYVQLQIAN